MNQDKLKKLDELFDREMEAERIGGASLLVEHKGKPEFQNVYGTDRADSIYKIYSMTKPITAAAVMMLYEQGKIDLYDPVSKYLKGFEKMKVVTPRGIVDARSQINIKQLLTMTSGLVYQVDTNEPERIMRRIEMELIKRMDAKETFSNIDICNALAEAPLLFHPGEGWQYGISADVLGGVVEAVSGVRYGEYLKKNLFDPLEMKDTAFYVEEGKLDRMAVMYSRKDSAGHLQRAYGDEPDKLVISATTRVAVTPPGFESGGAGLYSTLEDYRHFVQMLAAGGSYKGRRLLGRKTVEFMASSQLTPEQRKFIEWDSLEGYGYGSLMRVMLEPAMAGSNGSRGEYGWDGLAGTYFFVDPKEELIFVYMQQIEQGGDLTLRRKMRQIIYGALED